MTKYGFDFPKERIAKDVDRLTSQVWKLIPMRENGEDWVKQLNTVIIEISGLHEIFVFNPLFLQLLAKLEGMGKENPGMDFIVYCGYDQAMARIRKAKIQQTNFRLLL